MNLMLKFFPGLEPYLLAIKLFLAAVAMFGCMYSGWWLHGVVDAAASFKAQKQEVVHGNQVNAQDAAAAQAHETKRQDQAKHDVKTAQAAAVAATKPDYHTCQLTPADLAILNDAITGGDHARIP